MKHGGKRPGGGRRKGSKAAKTLEKEEARRLLREKVTAQLGPLVDAQIENALGIKYLVVRERKGGKFLRVTEAMAQTKLGKGEEIIEVWEKDPSIHAFTDLMNRALDKPKEQVLELNVHGDLVARLIEGRKRVAEAGSRP